MHDVQQEILMVNKENGEESHGDVYFEIIGLKCLVDMFSFSSR